MTRRFEPTRRGRPAAGDPAHWSHGLLTPAQERELAQRARAGERAARDELILKNQRLVLQLARAQRGGILDLHDLVSAGNRGLIRAVERFDPDRGVRLATYAQSAVRQAIQYEIQRNGRPIRIASWVLGLVARYRRTEALLSCAGGMPTDFARVCRVLRLTGRQCRCLQAALIVLRARFEPCGDGTNLVGPELPADRTADDREQRGRLSGLVARLAPNQRRVVRLHYGLGGGPGLPLGEIARRQGVRWQAVQNTRNRALGRLRGMADHHGGD